MAIALLAARSWYDGLSATELAPLLRPTALFVSGVLNVHSMNSADGITMPELGIVLDRSCAGGHTLLLLLGAVAFALRDHRSRSAGEGAGLFFAVLFGTYALTIIGNTSRVILSVIAARIDPSTAGATHHLIGIVVQLSLLLLTYVIIRRYVHRPA